MDGVVFWWWVILLEFAEAADSRAQRMAIVRSKPTDIENPYNGLVSKHTQEEWN